MYQSIEVLDSQAVLGLLAAIGWAAVVIAIVIMLRKISRFSKRDSQIVVLVLAAWATASLALASVNAYNYFVNGREILVESIENKNRIYGE